MTPTTHQLFNFKIPGKPSIIQLFSIPFFPPPILPLGPISLLPPVQGLPIGKTSSANLNKWAGWLTDPATSGRWGESDSKRSLFPGTALRIRVRPEFYRNRVPIKAVEVDTLQGVGNFLLHHSQHLPVQSIRCLGAFPRGPDMQ